MKKEWLKKNIYWIILGVVLIIVIFFLFSKTGFLQASKIDEVDLARWEYTDSGMIVGAKEFSLDGGNGTCWLMIHGYSSSPRDMETLAYRVNSEFGDRVEVIRLNGHGTVPSDLLDLTFNDWYIQVKKEFERLERDCDKVNVVGFSFGGALSLKLAENEKVNNLYVLAPFLIIKYNFWHILPAEIFVNMFADRVIYAKNLRPRINSPEGRENYLGYTTMPIITVKEFFPHFNVIIDDLLNIKSNVLIQHSRGDEVIDIKSSELVHERISSENKEFIVFEKTNHFLTLDYDKEEVMANIVEFERKFR